MPPNPLCDVCKTLNLSSTNNRKAAKYPLDFVQDIYRKSISHVFCPFCRLVIEFIGPGLGGQISIEWKDKGGFFFSVQGRTLAFIDEREAATSPYGAARRIEPTLDPELVKRWLQLCAAEHTEKCTPSTGVIRQAEGDVGVKTLRLIDTHNACLITAAPGDRYLALSYRWGNSNPPIRLEKNTKDLLFTTGAFASPSVRQKIPTTIRDAIDFVQMIGERYLWVDSLCLVQDCEEDMADGVANMDLVYQCAVCTIIAAAGKDYNAGLPGVHPGSRFARQNVVEVLPAISMAMTEGVYDAMQAEYMTRGWTKQVYFRCRTNCWSEDTIYDAFPSATNEILHSGSMVNFAENDVSKVYDTYTALLSRYADRHLSVETDTINAFTGILRFLSARAQSGLLEGLLTAAFDICIIFWDPWPTITNTPVRRRLFPSWSWAGWPGMRDGLGSKLSDPQAANAWLHEQTYIVWYKRGPRDSEPSLVWSVEMSEGYRRGRGYEACEIGYRASAGDPYGRQQHQRRAFAPQRSRADSEEEGGDTTYQTVPTQPADDARREAIISRELHKRSYHLLQFFAYTVRVHAFGEPPQSDPYTKLHPLLSGVTGHGTGNDGMHQQEIGRMKFDNHLKPEMGMSTHELVVLAKADVYDMVFNDTARIERPFYWVMLIKWVEEEEEKVVAERCGIGMLFQDCIELVVSPGMVWKEIVLA
ncbi:hypothetical protein JR316_0005707 [Psilocybe cubensis]|uniref:Uncharacterized protein n=1 Tax=Psilocybe cubensis TaxID=181762 RepID=A0ACB8H0J4_PSICU|nr:hypothetical protein JR316_0005707 [Psilocybe cubensis]KAH9481187.1 hypothetical protein JR316_0005707 [Psilocybe cubensis]